jgi:heme-degrading monooxygenase HmoA
MYVTIRAYQGNTELADALAAREDELRGVIGDIDGFQAYYLLKLNEGTTTVSVFDTQEGAAASNDAAAAWLKENLPDLQATPYVTAGEAVVSF